MPANKLWQPFRVDSYWERHTCIGEWKDKEPPIEHCTQQHLFLATNLCPNHYKVIWLFVSEYTLFYTLISYVQFWLFKILVSCISQNTECHSTATNWFLEYSTVKQSKLKPTTTICYMSHCMTSNSSCLGRAFQFSDTVTNQTVFSWTTLKKSSCHTAAEFLSKHLKEGSNVVLPYSDKHQTRKANAPTTHIHQTYRISLQSSPLHTKPL